MIIVKFLRIQTVFNKHRAVDLESSSVFISVVTESEVPESDFIQSVMPSSNPDVLLLVHSAFLFSLFRFPFLGISDLETLHFFTSLFANLPRHLGLSLLVASTHERVLLEIIESHFLCSLTHSCCCHLTRFSQQCFSTFHKDLPNGC